MNEKSTFAVHADTPRTATNRHWQYCVGSGRTLEGCQAIMVDKSEQEEMAKGQMRIMAKRVNDQVKGRYPIYFTEWNCNAILMSPSNDTKKVACFQVKSIGEMEPYVTGSSIRTFSDIFDEFMMMPDEFSGGFGLLTINGIPKPQFYALKLMSQTGDRRYDLPLPCTNEEIEIQVYEDDHQKQIFVYRQRMKNVAEQPRDYEISLELSAEPEHVVQYRIDDTHCNSTAVWEEMGSPTEMYEEQIEEIKQRSALVPEEKDICYRDGKLILTGTLNVNDVHCYQIRERRGI